jgi:hypothetical protein
MWLDFLIGFAKSIWNRTFSLQLVLDYLKDMVFFVLPLLILLNLNPLDPTGIVLTVVFYVCGLAIVLHYLFSIKRKIFG